MVPVEADSCEPGELLTCHCTDGSSAKQACDAQGKLGGCNCAVGAGPGDGGDGEGDGDDPIPMPSGQLCPELEETGACSEPAAFQAEQLPAYVMFVLDRSGSMNCNPPPLQSQADCDAAAKVQDPQQPTKWDIVAAEVRSLLGSLAGSGIHAGLTLFSTDSACGVDSTPLVAVDRLTPPHAAAMGAALDAFPPRGETPIVGATTLAYRHLHDELAVPGNRYVVLITDGAESCAEDRIADLLGVELPKARDALIRTFVIGAPGSEPGRGLLSELAYLGGTARAPDCVHVESGQGEVGDCHYDMTASSDFAQQLSQALEEIGGAALGCEFPVPDDGFASPGEDNVNVQYVPGGDGAPECLPPDFETPCDDPANAGWQFARLPDGGVDLSRVVVCGAACERIAADAQAQVEIIVGCPPLF